LLQSAVFHPYGPPVASAVRAVRIPAGQPPPSVEDSKVETVDLASLEVQAQYLLHDLDACLGEPIEAADTGGAVVVRGLVSDASRKAALSAALAVLRSPLLKIDILTYDEASRQIPARPVVPATQASARAARLPLEDVLSRHFRNDGERISAFSRDVVITADTALAQAWAVRRLHEKYDRPEGFDLTAASRRLVQAMKSDHEIAMRQSLRELRGLFGPIRELFPAGSQTPQTAGFESVRVSNGLVHGLFAGAGLKGRTVEDAVRQLWAELSAVPDQPSPAVNLGRTQ
jgi:hypothetical protein